MSDFDPERELERLLAGELSEEESDRFIAFALDKPDLVRRLQSHLVLEHVSRAARPPDSLSPNDVENIPRRAAHSSKWAGWRLAASTLAVFLLGSLTLNGYQSKQLSALASRQAKLPTIANVAVGRVMSVRASKGPTTLVRILDESPLFVLIMETDRSTSATLDMRLYSADRSVLIFEKNGLEKRADGLVYALVAVDGLFPDRRKESRRFLLELKDSSSTVLSTELELLMPPSSPK